MAHQVKLRLNTAEVEIAHKDVEVAIRDRGAKLGTLLISKGNIEWRPAKKSVRKHRFSWKKFAAFMEDEGKRVRGKRR
jgi:hypothetical protein